MDDAIRLEEKKQAQRFPKMNKKIREKRKEPLKEITEDDLKKYWEEEREKREKKKKEKRAARKEKKRKRLNKKNKKKNGKGHSHGKEEEEEEEEEEEGEEEEESSEGEEMTGMKIFLFFKTPTTVDATVCCSWYDKFH